MEGRLMDEFDFLSRVPLGQYVPTQSILHRLSPLTKIIMFGALMIAVMFTPSRAGLIAGVVIVFLLLLLSKVSVGFALKGLLAPLPFLLIIAIIQVFLYSSKLDPTSLVSIGWFHITFSGLWAGGMLLIRFCAIILLLSLGGFVISTSELLQGLTRMLSPLNRIGIRTMDFIMIIQVTLRFLPFLAQSAERIAKAQASRGSDWGVKKKGLINRIRQVVPMLIPLFITSLRRSENLALAMDARAYGIFNQRTSMAEFRYTWKDAAGVILSVMVSLAIFIV
jgi:energy-coupling factor transport system permease protein